MANSVPLVLKEGYLTFSSNKKSAWNKRYFKVTKHEKIQRYENEKMKKLNEEAFLADVESAEIINYPKQVTYHFEIKFDNSAVWKLKASSEEERKAWISVFTIKQRRRSQVHFQTTTPLQTTSPTNVANNYMASNSHYYYQPYQVPSYRGLPHQQQLHGHTPMPPPYPNTIPQWGPSTQPSANPPYPNSDFTAMPNPTVPQYPTNRPVQPNTAAVPSQQGQHYYDYIYPPANTTPSHYLTPANTQTSPPNATNATGNNGVPATNSEGDGYVVMMRAKTNADQTKPFQYDYVHPRTASTSVTVHGTETRPKISGVFTTPSSTNGTNNDDTLTERMRTASIESKNKEYNRDIPHSKLSNFKKIGKGNFGEVFQADYALNDSTRKVAIKVIKNEQSQKAKDDMVREFAAMATMVHPNIVQLYGVVSDDDANPKIVLEYFPYGDLKTYLKNSPQKPVSTLVQYMIHVSMGMHYLAGKGLIHRDLAARNVLVGEGEICKVSDFGLVKELPSNMDVYLSKTEVPLPIRWMAPEALADRIFSEASDVWSYGILQWEMFHPTVLPYNGIINELVFGKVSGGYRLPVPEDCPPIVANIMTSCWSLEPQDRPTFHYITTELTTKI